MKKTIVITAGGSGGHIVPAGVLASTLKKDYNILFLTDKRGLRYKNFIPASVKIISIPCSALGGKGKLSRAFALAWTSIGILKSILIFFKYKPIGTIGFAGYASFPACVASGLLKKKLILHEQNTVFGKTNRILSHWATAIATSFPKEQTRSLPRNKKIVFTGLPLRRDITKLSNHYPSMTKTINLLITGGSQGARFLNAISEILCTLPKEIKKKMRITQQIVDIEEKQKIKNIYEQAGITAYLPTFISDMPAQIQQCHLFIGSAGSMILEVQMLRRPMILIPLKIASENHQENNARAIEESGGAKIILEKEFSRENFRKMILNLLSQPQKLKAMHQNLKPRDGLKTLVNLVKEIMP
ncbi:MAG: UDP-N-acetylglucosamine--N-acetylmuramyl-(pentapeptide) pyrophosphoryl-undecaprenol N-acetylglucosamine transferase [Alphaproteobacteria bacterium]|nr:UDP-N-acetylglucosamine--N-acetylmuramyl-(pentapeptide) pyrophosphoryl-undecaprenol N-acetylglucosamine transferase [Alphaproteobacteria bacterium]